MVEYKTDCRKCSNQILTHYSEQSLNYSLEQLEKGA